MMEVSTEEFDGGDKEEMDVTFEPRTSTCSHFPNQRELDDLVKDLGLTKSGAETLAAKPNEWNLLRKD